jgi:ribonuclease BN (tRNA processing enzyme)
MRLTILGAGPAYTSRRGAAASSYLVQEMDGEGPASLVLDLGQGAFSNLAATVDPGALSALLVSHLHPDHFIDLVALRHYLKWEFQPPRRVRVFGPVGLTGRIDALDDMPGFAAAALDLEKFPAEDCRIGPFTVRSLLVTHTAESYAFRISAGGDGAAGLVYSGDCAVAEDLLPLIHPGDTMLCEATFGAGPVPDGAEHMTSADAGRVASSSGASRLLLTHILAGHSRVETISAAQAHFSGPVQLVTEGQVFEI